MRTPTETVGQGLEVPSGHLFFPQNKLLPRWLQQQKSTLQLQPDNFQSHASLHSTFEPVTSSFGVSSNQKECMLQYRGIHLVEDVSSQSTKTTMETDEFQEEPLAFPDEDSGSAYELSKNDRALSQDGSPLRSRATKFRRSESHASRARATSSLSRSRANSSPERELSLTPGEEERLNAQIREDAIRWAANFQEPQSPSEIKTPPRNLATSRKRKPRQSPGAGVELRAKRLKVYWNNDYRESLNNEILDTVRTTNAETVPLLPASQIGASIWTSEEKSIFFDSLARLGKGNVRGIAKQIRTKSILETDEYLRLLHQSSVERVMKSDTELKLWLSMPTAIELSNECTEILERAGDSLAIKQQQMERVTEEEKWGAAWLIDESISKRLSKHNPGGKKASAFDEVLPAANLFNLRNWVELSSKVFMNPAEPYEENNWHNVADVGETPAIRATAMEDFHSLAVSVTKRLISTTFFCTMSRERALASKKVKHGNVTIDDVEAAVRILGMKSDSHEFWLNCARRCKLQVIDENDKGREESMTYEDVEEEMRARRQRSSRSRSRSRSHSVHSRVPEPSPTPSSASDVSIRELEEDILIPSRERDSDEESDLSDSDTTTYQESTARRSLARQEDEKKQDLYINECDIEASKAAELELWTLLGQEPPLELNLDEVLEPMNTPTSQRIWEDDTGNWRENVEYWSSWEVFDRPVPKENFEKNRKKISKRARRIAEAEEESSDDGVSDGEDMQVDEESAQEEVDHPPVNLDPEANSDQPDDEEETSESQPSNPPEHDEETDEDIPSPHPTHSTQNNSPQPQEEEEEEPPSDSPSESESPNPLPSPFKHRAHSESSSPQPEGSLQSSIEGDVDVLIKSEEE
ncbi:hypothetical protein HYALB_00000115 [Hymenoscyphus albidus]|uniref:Myb-like domain-containing protein n=1 Tax=Hymenoscyphus albidus TaxID=595503 RepID=A0A9N9Q3G3_9HELO|nr:hypothetical protein HYALB_00000115 [Hymenoscyphus albidus]